MLLPKIRKIPCLRRGTLFCDDDEPMYIGLTHVSHRSRALSESEMVAQLKAARDAVEIQLDDPTELLALIDSQIKALKGKASATSRAGVEEKATAQRSDTILQKVQMELEAAGNNGASTSGATNGAVQDALPHWAKDETLAQQAAEASKALEEAAAKKGGMAGKLMAGIVVGILGFAGLAVLLTHFLQKK